MASRYPVEKKNQIVSRILSGEITVAEAHRTYGVATSCLYTWIKAVRGSVKAKPTSTEIPLPQGMNLLKAIAAAGHCKAMGFDSADSGKYCRGEGISLEELKAFSLWLDENDKDVVLATRARAREQELIGQVNQLNEAAKQQSKELERKDKALAEAAALLVLSKKAAAIWGDEEK